MLQKSLGFFFLFLTASMASASQSIIAYALKQGFSQGAMLLSAKSVKDVILDPLVSEEVKNYLLLSREVLANAESLPMKTGSAYRRFVALERDWVTQIVIAAEKSQLEPKKFVFPVVGSFPYKGFFDEEDATEEAHSLEAQYDVYQRKVPAFSSLAWFSDPITSNLFRSEEYLVETLFHELVHLNFYFSNKSDFNEAFATWFAQKAATDFLLKSKKILNPEKFKIDMQNSEKIDLDLNAFIGEISERGKEFYGKMLLQKKTSGREKYFAWIKTCLKKYPTLQWLEKTEWNNAAVLSFSTYYRLVPTIEKFAQMKSLGHKKFLEELVRRGPEMANEVESTFIPEARVLCGSVN